MPILPKTGNMKILDEANVYDQMPPFWALIADHLLPISVVLLAGSVIAGLAAKHQPAERRRSRKLLSIVAWGFCVLALIAFAALILEGIATLVEG